MSSFRFSNLFPWRGRETKMMIPPNGASGASSVEGTTLTADHPLIVDQVPIAPAAVAPPPLPRSEEEPAVPCRKKRGRAPDLVVHHQKKKKNSKMPKKGVAACDVNMATTMNDCGESTSSSSTSSMEEQEQEELLAWSEQERPIKWLRASETRAVPIAPPPPLQKLPDDLLLRCLLYVSSNEDRYALQCTSRTFRRLSNAPVMLRSVDVTEHLVNDNDTPESAVKKLEPYAAAWNLPALYMLGTIRTYCYPHVEQGISLLKVASSSGYVPAHYSLGLVLRDTAPDEADYYMQQAVDAQYFPAFQEVLSDAEMKKRTSSTGTGTGGTGPGGGDVNAQDLLAYMDPSCLSRLLCRHYCLAKRLRMANTSHCWNPKCGRWAFRCSHRVCTHQGRHTTVVVGVSRMKVCSRCCRAKYCSKLCQVYDWRSGQHQTECQYLM